MGELAVATVVGAVVGAAVARPRHDPVLHVEPEPLEPAHRCECTMLRVRTAHLEQQLALYQSGQVR